MNDDNSIATTPIHVEQHPSGRLSREEARTSPGGLALFEAAKRALSAALADAKRVDEVMGVRLRVEQMALHARQAKDRDLIADAMELQLTAERKLGEMLIVAKETGQISQGGRPRKAGHETPDGAAGVFDKATLAQAGVTYKLSAKAQKLAEYDEDRFADVLATARAKIKAGGAVVVNPIKDLKTADKQLLRAVKEAQLAARQQALPDKTYGVILEDPEWQFETYSAAGMSRSADNHYSTSTTEVIAARPVGDRAAADCVLFLWATVPMLPQALLVMEARGFAYKTHFVWDKVEPGTGFWNRNQHELLLVGTRGDIPAPAAGTQWPSLIAAPKGAHSEKPDWAYELIEHHFPNLPKIELNARRRRDGWDAWGFEAPEDESPAESTQADAAEVSAHETDAQGDETSRSVSSPELRPDGPAEAGDDSADPLSSPVLNSETDPGAGAPGVMAGDGEGEAVGAPALPNPAFLDDEAKSELIRQGYAVDRPLIEIMAQTGLSKDAVKSRAKRMGIGSRDRQRRMASDFTTKQRTAQ
jgi:N6-adenosine-specific RNA methylase IME4